MNKSTRRIAIGWTPFASTRRKKGISAEAFEVPLRWAYGRTPV